MFLRSLTIKGFKSFARRTVLDFEPGVTIVVGPNGSGKSNIADAVMWLLGEQSPTSLRGNRMEDVIFSGSNSLRPVNMAEVSLTLDNANKDFPLDYAEVTITRNVVRGGDSEYRLNNTPCRLLDIQELLSDAGVGRTLNSVISQGNLDDVLTCRPEERRDYIEEAGGLLKYRKRREKAIRRLARMDEEVLRTNDVAREVKRQLRPLQRQAGRLEEYQVVARELGRARLRLDVARLRVMRGEWQEHEERQAERSRKLDELDGGIARLGSEASALEASQAAWRSRESELRSGLYRLVSLHERLKAMLGLWEEKTRRVLEEDAALPPPDPSELENLAGSIAELERRRDELAARLESLKAREGERTARFAALNGALNETVRKRAALEARAEVIEAAALAGDVDHRERARELAVERERLVRELEEMRQELASLEIGHLEATAGLEGAVGELESLQSRRVEVLNRLREMDRRQAGLVATLDILTRLETETWSQANTSAALVADDPTGGGLGGMLVGSLEIDEGRETAICGYLGPWLYGVIARDTGAVVAAIGHLKKRGLGQGLFFRRGGERLEKAAPASIDGALPARDSVRAPQWFSDALDVLLEGAYLVEDLASAVELAGKYPALKFLTPDGDAITGGTLVKGGSSVVSEAEKDLTAGRRRGIEEALARAREELDELELDQAGTALAIRDASAAVQAARGRRNEARDALDETRSKAASLEAGIAALETGAPAVGGPGAGPWVGGEEGEELAALIATARAEEEERRLELERGEGSMRSAAAELQEAASELAAVERRLEIARIRERDLEARGRGPGGRTAASMPGPDELAMLTALHERLTDGLDRAREKARRELDAGVLAEKEAAESLRGLRGRMGELQAGHEALRDQMHGEDLARAELKVKVEQLVDGITGEHKMPLEFALKQYPGDEPVEELENEVEVLAARVEQIGPVNPEAIIERESLEQRYTFLKEQMDDIEKARAQLKRVIKQVDDEIQQKFRETLELVNGHFVSIFSTLFPNGAAELRLTDPDDLLNSGVEIMAQPEGKRLRRISLLSGGETSMTALAFFFALFRVRPSPFYFLDEVEAALDDVNLHRFLDLVREFKGSSQLVLITHQKRSMEIADVLYGITMQDDGMSRVLSQRMEEAGERAAS